MGNEAPLIVLLIVPPLCYACFYFTPLFALFAAFLSLPFSPHSQALLCRVPPSLSALPWHARLQGQRAPLARVVFCFHRPTPAARPFSSFSFLASRSHLNSHCISMFLVIPDVRQCWLGGQPTLAAQAPHSIHLSVPNFFP